MRVAYCPSCGTEITVKEIEYVTQNITWTRCCAKGCRCRELKTSSEGFILEPPELAGRYIFTRPFQAMR